MNPDQAELSDRIYQSLRQAADADLRGLADLLARPVTTGAAPPREGRHDHHLA